jgi:hypothetical protein
VLDNGIEISMGFDKSTWKLLSFMLNLFQYLILSYIDKLKYKSFNSGLLSFINFNFSLYANFLIVFSFKSIYTDQTPHNKIIS